MGEYAVRCRQRWTAGETLDISKEMMRLTLAVVGKTLFSADVESEASEIGAALTTVLKMFRMLLMPFAEYVEKLPLPAMRRFEKPATAWMKPSTGSFASGARAVKIGRPAFHAAVIAGRRGPWRPHDGQQVRDEALTLFLAGHETTANALTWTWYLLSQNPECERRLHEEIDCRAGGPRACFRGSPKLALYRNGARGSDAPVSARVGHWPDG